eukprot:2899756-Amphidinium_carterae.2
MLMVLEGGGGVGLDTSGEGGVLLWCSCSPVCCRRCLLMVVLRWLGNVRLCYKRDVTAIMWLVWQVWYWSGVLAIWQVIVDLVWQVRYQRSEVGASWQDIGVDVRMLVNLLVVGQVDRV